MNPAAKNDKAKNDKANNDKELHIIKILRYQDSKRFGSYVQNDLKIKYSREQLNKMTPDKLETILHRIRTNLNNKNVDSMIDGMVHTCAVGYEHVVSQFYDIDGFTQLLLQNPGFHDAVERYKCESQMPDIPPGLQISYIVASTTLAAHSINKAKHISQKPSVSGLVVKEDKVIVDTPPPETADKFTIGEKL